MIPHHFKECHLGRTLKWGGMAVLLVLSSLLLLIPVVSSQAQQSNQAVISQITDIIKEIETMEAEQQELLKRQEQAIEKIKSLKVWTSKFR
ncbi:MAG: hypothetical protein A3G87_04450 [Omnitrophica bacterium RIFCSPLOWO2_12_FULL_50_11]|nr:MAG: hypothetical protein A3G87_04450 [Omnitrophica bacterium RIFCSPLOWO2_12_FULL_50_11]